MMDPTGHRMRPQAAPDGPERPGTPIRPTRTHSDRQRPPSAPQCDADAGPVGADSPYYVREWRGGPLYECPECRFPTRTHAAVAKHRGIVHPSPRTPTVEERARRAGIITSR